MDSGRVRQLAAARRLRAFLIPAVRPADLARKAGCTRQYVHDVTSGRVRASRRIIRACVELGLPADVIFGPDEVAAALERNPADARREERS